MTSPRIWSHRLQTLPMSSLSNLGFLHKIHLLILLTSGSPHMGNLSLKSWAGVARVILKELDSSSCGMLS